MDRIGKFELLEELGRGGMGVVYRARDTIVGRDVAIKVIRPERGDEPDTRSRFIREFRAAAALNHPGIATLYEAGETDDGRLFFAAELIAGETLTQRIRRGPLSSEDCLALGCQLAAALGAAHRRGIVHRDVKPDNLVVRSDGRLKILDFGLARHKHSTVLATTDATLGPSTVTQEGAVIGTPRYMSPEQATGEAVDARTDVFASGLVLYEMATGNAAFAADSIADTLRKVLSEDPPPVDELHPGLPPGLGGVIRKAMAKSPGERFASGGELAEALEGLRAVAARPARGRTLAWVAAVAGVLLALAVVFWPSDQPTLDFGDRDKLLIADVENHTGEEIFDLALKTAIESDLQQSPYVVVYGKNQVVETLQLMRQEPGARIDEELGRNICRYAGLKALVIPRILSAGDAYDLQTVIVDPITGRHVDTLRVTAEGREQVLLEVVDTLARELRSRLGESLASIEESDLPVAEHTTASWDALHSLTLGDKRWQEGRADEAAAFFERALEYDPGFPAAKGSLGLLYLQFLNEPDKGKTLLREALDLADDVTEQERLVLRALNREFVDGDLEGALDDYEMIVELYPDLFPPYNNRGQILLKLGRLDEAVAAFEQAAEIERRSAIPLWALVRTHLWGRLDPAASGEAVRRLLDLMPEHPGALNLLGWCLAAENRFVEAEEAFRAVLEQESQHPLALPNLAHVLMRMDRPGEAVPLYRTLVELIADGRVEGSHEWSSLQLALALRESGQTEEVLELIRSLTERVVSDPPAGLSEATRLLMLAAFDAVAGDRESAEQRLEQALSGNVTGPVHDRTLAEVHSLLGNRDAGLEALRKAIESGTEDIFFLRLEPTLRSLQDDPRFDEMVAEFVAG